MTTTNIRRVHTALTGRNERGLDEIIKASTSHVHEYTPSVGAPRRWQRTSLETCDAGESGCTRDVASLVFFRTQFAQEMGQD